MDPKGSMKILLADADDVFIGRALDSFQTRAGIPLQVDVCRSGPAFLDHVYSRPYDLVFLSVSLPETSALDLLSNLFQTSLPIPLVMLSDAENARLAVEAMKKGVLDFLLKSDFLAINLAEFLKKTGETSRHRRENAELTQIAQMKNDFLATISHELRTPLTSILGLSDVLASGRLGPLEKPQGETLNKILDQSRNLVRLINQLLDIRSLSKGEERGERTRFSLAGMVKEKTDEMKPLFSEKGVSLDVSLPAGEEDIVAHRADMEKAVGHVLSNALKFTPRGGRVSVEAAANGEFVQLKVSDTGLGIPPEALPFIFEKFFHVDASLTRPYGGMGLGLAFCKEVMDISGGRIRAESSGPGRGATVVFLWPRAAAPAAALPAASRPRSLLWVDDNPEMLELVEVGFTSISRSVTLKTVSSGAEALKMTAVDVPDLIVLDIMMPDMDGLELIGHLKADARTKKVPILVVTGYREATKTAIERGAIDVCLKPFHLTDIVKRIESILFPAA